MESQIEIFAVADNRTESGNRVIDWCGAVEQHILDEYVRNRNPLGQSQKFIATKDDDGYVTIIHRGREVPVRMVGPSPE